MSIFLFFNVVSSLSVVNFCLIINRHRHTHNAGHLDENVAGAAGAVEAGLQALARRLAVLVHAPLAGMGDKGASLI